MTGVLSIVKSTVGSNGSPGTDTVIDALGPPMLRYKTADDAVIDLNDTVPIPSSGSNFSYANSLFAKCTFAPDTQINNFKVYTDLSTFGTGITLWIGDQFPTHNSGSSSGYRVATGTEGTSGDDIDGGYSGISSKSDLFTFDETTPFSGPTISESGSVIDAVNETTNYFILQAEVDDTTTSGDKDDKDGIIQYDEI